MSTCKFLPYQVFPASQKETGHLLRPAGRAVAFWGLGLGTATEGHHGKELMRGEKQSRGWGERGRQNYVKGESPVQKDVKSPVGQGGWQGTEVPAGRGLQAVE